MEQDHKDYFPTDEELVELRKIYPDARVLSPIKPGPRKDRTNIISVSNIGIQNEKTITKN